MSRGQSPPAWDGLDQRGRAEEVGGEQFLDLVVGGLLDGGAVAMPSVIDQDVDGTEALTGGAHDLIPLGAVGDIERERERVPGCDRARSSTLAASRAVTTTFSPRLRTAVASARPKPPEQPVMSQVTIVITFR
jgi:hypothetical protein